jgi:hypothetical protein
VIAAVSPTTRGSFESSEQNATCDSEPLSLRCVLPHGRQRHRCSRRARATASAAMAIARAIVSSPHARH